MNMHPTEQPSSEPLSQDETARLRLIRLDRDWTFEQMAERVGVTAAVLRKALGADKGQPNERNTFKVRRWLAGQVERPEVTA